MPNISIIVPVYKVEAYLSRCVDSILGQSYGDFELILVDDGSPDNCGAICDDYARKDSRIHVIHQENGGLSAARNAGIDWAMANSDSRFLTFVDSDDWIHREYLAVLMDMVREHGVKIAMGGIQNQSSREPDGPLLGDRGTLYEAEEAYCAHYVCCMSACAKLIWKDLFRELRFPVGKLHEDAYVTHLLLFGQGETAITREALYGYYVNPDSITRANWSPRRLDELDAHEKRLDYFREKQLPRAYRMELAAYVQTTFAQAAQLNQLAKEDAAYRKPLKELGPKLRSVLKQGRESGLFPYSQENLWLYELAYPLKPLWHSLYLIRRWKNKRRT